MSKIGINWGRNLDPTQRIKSPGDKPYVVLPQLVTYGTYPITDAVRSTVKLIRQ